MRVPLHWLRELVDIDVSTEELAERLSHTGSAVDAIDRFAAGVSGIVVGRVIEVADAEGSDKLCIARIDVGEGSPLQILAGAKNFGVGDLVPVARVGARVTTLDVPIAARKMMGTYESQGMLCSAKELGVADEHEGILLFGDDATVGADVAALLGLDDDVLEFEIYPNRPDQMSVLGIAREVALLYDVPLRRPDASVIEEGATETASATSVTIEDRAGCPRYLARVIEDVTFGVSPPLVRARLTACGVRPLGNLIDATNYVLLLCGQPLHAFDMDLLDEERIVVRTARPGERMETLDGVERHLGAEDLVIADASKAQALAGIMGGGTSEVSETTRRVLLESAFFDPVRISRTSRRHHLRSEASARFERGADPEIVPDAAAMAAELIRRWAGGTVLPGAVDVGGAPQRRTVVLRPERVETILGAPVGAGEVSRLLTGLGCDVAGEGPLEAIIPSWRPDLEREIDLIEEVARLHGYDRFEPIRSTGPRGGRSVQQVLREKIRDALLGAGLSEATLPTFCATEDIAAIGYDGPLVTIANPMTEDQGRLRPSLFPGLLRAAQRNIAHGASVVRLFEFGKVFRGWPAADALPDEIEHVAFVLAGELDAHWSADARSPDAYDALGLLDLVLDEIGAAGRVLSTDDLAPLFHPGRSAKVMLGGAMAGRFGELRPSVARAFGLEPPVVVGGLALGVVFAAAPTAHRTGQLPNQPPVLRDLSLWLPDGVAAGDVIATIRSSGGDLLEGVDVLDEYRPSDDPRRSVTFGLTFRARERTLRAEEADAARAGIVEAVAREHGAEAR